MRQDGTDVHAAARHAPCCRSRTMLRDVELAQASYHGRMPSYGARIHTAALCDRSRHALVDRTGIRLTGSNTFTTFNEVQQVHNGSTGSQR
jgi:hypothetical protein